LGSFGICCFFRKKYDIQLEEKNEKLIIKKRDPAPIKKIIKPIPKRYYSDLSM
jgi:hypothetical protein